MSFEVLSTWRERNAAGYEEEGEHRPVSESPATRYLGSASIEVDWEDGLPQLIESSVSGTTRSTREKLK